MPRNCPICHFSPHLLIFSGFLIIYEVKSPYHTIPFFPGTVPCIGLIRCFTITIYNLSAGKCHCSRCKTDHMLLCVNHPMSLILILHYSGSVFPNDTAVNHESFSLWFPWFLLSYMTRHKHDAA